MRTSLGETSTLPGPTRCTVYLADALRVETGVMEGEALGAVEDSMAGDLFRFEGRAVPAELLLAGGTVAPGSSVGRPGAAVAALARHQLMGERGALVEALVLELDGVRLLMPFGPLSERDEYTLLRSRPATEGELAGAASVAFAAGTRITMAGGAQAAVEDIRAGDRVLTRDNGPQAVRWTGRRTVTAEGSDAPVVLAPGAMNNADELVLSPDHRLYVWQRTDLLGAGGAEVLVRARHLVNGTSIVRRDMPSLTLCHLLLDAHEIIYAEGIPAESLLVAPEVLAGMGGTLAEDLSAAAGDVDHTPRAAWEPSAADLDGLDAADALRRASRR
ncbi:Hint domain-containing protein [Jannaschia sp. Os4]|uniref:Hint domain-containing protein n=1 Tax=Jannaschia sp. Os4 TaxID=2807617 RepID=UPI001939D1BA|nr:Hint domain-containing protein [Jannaschia sp. Os4]MBM2576004.1 Hint domain-containing protein [Jannaschia sp. Os4]